MQADLLKLLQPFDVISFDVFDTLLARAYLTQEDLWAEMGRSWSSKLEFEDGERIRSSESKSKSGIENCIALLKKKIRSIVQLQLHTSTSSSLHASTFLDARIAADRKTYAAATGRGGEHTLDEAYRLMPKKFAALEAEEEKLQRECLHVNDEMLEVWKRAGELGKKRIIVSDMYLSAAWFAETLKEKGFGDYDALYVSSARQARKSSGKLFDVVRNDFPDAKILHIGDNFQSDKIMPQEHGLNGWHYPNFREQLFTECPFLRSFINDYPSHEKRLLAGELALGWQQFTAHTASVSYWHRLGYFFGGLLGHIYVAWLAKTAAATGIDHLMFVARDGYLWKQMFDRLNTGIRTDYFYAPRLVSLKVCGVIGSDPLAIEDRRKILESLPPFDSEMERQKYGKYISQFNICDKTAIVDGVSSAFSVQSLVERAVGRTVPTFYVFPLVAALKNGHSLFPCHKGGAYWQGLSEYLFSSPERPIVDVDSEGPVYSEDILPDETFRESIFGDIADGAMHGFHVLNNAWRKHQGLQNVDARQFWLDLVDALAVHMSQSDIENLSRAKNAWNLRQDNFSAIINPRQPDIRVTRRWGLPLGFWRGRSTPESYVRTFYAFNRWPVLNRSYPV